MNESERSELERLKQRQARLEQELLLLGLHLRALEARLAKEAPKLEEAPEATPLRLKVEPPVPKPEPAKPPPLPPIIPRAPLPPPAPVVAKPPPEPEPQPAVATMPEPSMARVESEPFVPPVSPPTPPSARVPEKSFEMRLGTYWLVRIGAVLVLTGLVFFGNLAYKKMEAGGKVALLYLASGLLLGAGTWWQRKSVKESLKNYAQVLFAGGLAAVYFTTYAAHHVEALKVIQSAFVDGALLLIWAGFMAWIADRKKSELLALFAVGLAYYSSVITPVSTFTLFSNLVLTVAALFFLVRNRWAGLSWASLIATYFGYAYWRFYHGGEGWRWAMPDEGLWFGASFLWSYWLVFTVAVFLSKHKNMAGEKRAAFLTFNNGAMFTLFIMTMFKVDSGRFWQFSLGYGIVLLALAELARRFLSAEPITKNTYLTQGLVLVTVGIISRYIDRHQQLALMLAAESVILFILGTLRKNIFLQTGAYITGGLAVGWGIDSVERFEAHGLWLGVVLGALMVVNAFWSHWRMMWADRREFRPVPAYFTVLALVIWMFTTWQNTSHENFGFVLTLVAIALTFSIYALRVPEVPLLGMGYILAAQASLFFHAEVSARKIALAMAANAAALLFVGSRRKSLALQTGGFVAAAFAVLWGIGGLEKYQDVGPWNAGLFVGILLGTVMAAKAFWIARQSPADDVSDAKVLRPAPAYFTALALLMWIVTTWFNTERENFPLVLALEAVVLTVSVHWLRVREFPLLGQGLLVLAHVMWLEQYLSGKAAPPWWNPILMIAVTLGISHWWQRQKVVRGDPALSQIFQTMYALASVALVCIWLEPHNSISSWIAVTSLFAVVVTAYGVATRAWPLAICGQIFLIVSGVRLVTGWAEHRPDWQFPLAPIAAMGLLSLGTWIWFARKPESKSEARTPLLQVAMVYRWVALIMSLWWVTEYIRERQRVWVYVLVGLVVFGFAGWRRSREALLFGAVFTLAGFVTLWLTFSRELLVYLPNFLAVLVLLGQQQIARKFPDRYAIPRGVQSAVIIVGGLSLWRLVSHWVSLGAGGFYLTASWSALAFALFGCGVALREKMYRWVGLGILAAALGRIVIFDVWKLETIYRVLSFMALGIVLIVLGFIYIKYEERIRKWL